MREAFEQWIDDKAGREEFYAFLRKHYDKRHLNKITLAIAWELFTLKNFVLRSLSDLSIEITEVQLAPLRRLAAEELKRQAAEKQKKQKVRKKK